ncbi:MAG TPA: type II secretion system protein [Candidatus Dormibacteraeota bacterium]|nr:type II secretion system protein [Candidatus Dormibacteraeota bacterium]
MNKWLKRLKKDERGLTLVELLAVVVILAIVAAIAFVLVGNVIDNSKRDAHIANAQQIISAAKLAEASGDIEFSETAKDIFSDGNELDTLGKVVDPWDKEDYNKAEISKKDGEYSITLTPDKGCNIEERSESVLQQGRDEACGTD